MSRPERCTVCRGDLTKTERANGLRRCRACRQKTPGNGYSWRHGTRRASPAQYAGLRKGLRGGLTQAQKAKSPPVGSWWLGLSREQFQAGIAARFPEASPAVSFTLAMGANGRCDG